MDHWKNIDKHCDDGIIRNEYNRIRQEAQKELLKKAEKLYYDCESADEQVYYENIISWLKKESDN